MDEQQIERCIKSCCLGDRQAYETLIKAHYSQVYLLCLSILTNEHDALEITQEVFLKAYTELGKLKKTSSFSSWISQIARNSCINLLRKKKPAGLLVRNLPERKEQIVKYDDLQLAVKRLPEEIRLPLMMYYFDGKNVNTVARTMNVSASAVYSKLRIACKLLFQLLTEEGHKK